MTNSHSEVHKALSVKVHPDPCCHQHPKIEKFGWETILHGNYFPTLSLWFHYGFFTLTHSVLE